MLKVECEACKAPYQVDERRVPPTGLKMRCPKCGHAFTVAHPDTKGPVPSAPMSKHTIMGVAAPVAAAAPPGLPSMDEDLLPQRAAPKAPAKAGAPAAASAPELPSMDEDLLPQRAAPKAPPKAAPPKAPPVPVQAAPAKAAPAKPAPPKAPPAKAAPPRVAPLADAPGLGDFDELLDLPAMPDAGLPAAIKPLAPVKPTLLSQQEKPGAKPAAAIPSLADYDIDLPSPTADLPAMRGAGGKPAAAAATKAQNDLPAAKGAAKPAANPPTVGGALTFDVDLPMAAKGPGDLPSAKAGGKSKNKQQFADLPSPAGGEADLPMAFGDVGLPAAFGDIGLPAPAGGGGFGSIDLPAVGASPGLPMHAPGASALPSAVDQERYLPRAAAPGAHLPAAVGAGMHLPSAVGAGMHLPSVVDALPSAVGDHNYLPSHQAPAGDFGAADFGDPFAPAAGDAPGYDPPPQVAEGGQGGVGFGELDFGASGGGDVSMEADLPGGDGGPAPFDDAGAEAALPPADAAPTKTRERVVISAGQSRTPKLIIGGIALLIIAGGALELTAYGAYGRHAISDGLHKTEWAAGSAAALAKARKIIGADLYDQTRAAADGVAAQTAAVPRSRSLAATAALVEYEFQLRYGRDAARATRADAWLASIAALEGTPDKVLYYTAASAGRTAAQGDAAGARTLLDAAAAKDTGDPVQADIALIRGEVELKAKDASAANKAFTRALQVVPSARAHFGLARSFALGGDRTKALAEVALTLAATPNHPGALVLKATFDWTEDRNDTAVIDGLKPILEGPAKASASSPELSSAFTLFGLAQVSRGDMGAARTAFESALKLDGSNAQALLGQGEVFFAEGRNTEALSRFDIAVQLDPTNPSAIVADAKAKLALERLADAKTQLSNAQKTMPKVMPITYWLGQAEEKLGNKPGAEEAYIAAIAMTTPKDRDAIAPYVSLSTLLAGQGRAVEAQAKLNEARAKLPDSAIMQRALGEVAAAQGLYDEAIGHYEAAAAKAPNDLKSRFLLGVTYLHMRRLDEAAAQFDKVAAADPEYPNLAMERGELLEASGHIDQALEQFKAALAKAPKDLDLQLRVGAAYVGIGRGEEGVKTLKPVFDARQNSAEVNHYLGRAYLLVGGPQLVAAQRHLQKAIDIEPTRAEYHVYLAWAATEQRDLKLGQTEVEKALALDQLQGDAYWQRAIIEQIKGEVEDAIRDANKALVLHPSRNEAHATLAMSYENKNQPDKALAEWNIATTRNPEKPDWEFLYGRLLYVHRGAVAALQHVLSAAKSGEQMHPLPSWLPQDEFMVGMALFKSGNRVDAKPHLVSFLNTGDIKAPDRPEATATLLSIDPAWRPQPQ